MPNAKLTQEDHVSFLMTSDVFEHCVMAPEDLLQIMKEILPSVTCEGCLPCAASFLWSSGKRAGRELHGGRCGGSMCSPLREDSSGTYMLFQQQRVIRTLSNKFWGLYRPTTHDMKMSAEGSSPELQPNLRGAILGKTCSNLKYLTCGVSMLPLSVFGFCSASQRYWKSRLGKG